MLRHFVVCASILTAAPAAAQFAGPALPAGAELSLSITQAAFETVSMVSGVAGTYRRVGRLNIAARYATDVGDGTFAELGSFGRIATLPAGIELGWNAGLGYASGQAGIYAPVGLTASRALQIRGVNVAPFAEGRVQVQELTEPSLDAGHLSHYLELGAQIQVLDAWSVRASASTSSNASGVAFGIARRL